jgi:hypothetical protein
MRRSLLLQYYSSFLVPMALKALRCPWKPGHALSPRRQGGRFSKASRQRLWNRARTLLKILLNASGHHGERFHLSMKNGVLSWGRLRLNLTWTANKKGKERRNKYIYMPSRLVTNWREICLFSVLFLRRYGVLWHLRYALSPSQYFKNTVCFCVQHNHQICGCNNFMEPHAFTCLHVIVLSSLINYGILCLIR